MEQFKQILSLGNSSSKKYGIGEGGDGDVDICGRGERGERGEFIGSIGADRICGGNNGRDICRKSGDKGICEESSRKGICGGKGVLCIIYKHRL